MKPRIFSIPHGENCGRDIDAPCTCGLDFLLDEARRMDTLRDAVSKGATVSIRWPLSYGAELQIEARGIDVALETLAEQIRIRL